MCVTGCLCVPADGESLGEREEWKDDSEDIVGRDTPTDHKPLKRDEPQVCGGCVCMWEGGGGVIYHLFRKGRLTAFSMQPVDSVVSFQCCPEDVVDTSHDREATPTTQSRDQIGATPPDHVGMSEAQQRIVDSLQDAGNVRTHTSIPSFCTPSSCPAFISPSLDPSLLSVPLSSPSSTLPLPSSPSHLHRLLCLQLNQCHGVNTLSRYSYHPLTLSPTHTPPPLHHSTSTTLPLPTSFFAFSDSSLPPSFSPSQVNPLPPGGISASQCCETCGVQREPWVCLSCYHVRKRAVGLSQLLPCKEESRGSVSVVTM